MAHAPTQIAVPPKEMGRHLRSIRRRKGLSLSEVARGAGLSRRELVAYERGKVSIPESDLWVLAGSCGVDVAELVPTTPSNELTVAASATSIADTVSQLRRAQEDLGITAYLHTLHKLQALPPGKRIPVKERELEAIATALGSTPHSIEVKLQEILHVATDEAERLRAMILVPPSGRGKPRALAAAPSIAAAEAVASQPVATNEAPVEPPTPAQPPPVAPVAFLDTPLDAPVDPVHGHNIDVFEELARLPEPVPLADPSEPVPDVLATQDPFSASPFEPVPVTGLPDGTVELVDSAVPSPGSTLRGGTTTDATPAWNAVDAPPIDVATRQGSSTWDLGEPPPVTPAPVSGPDAWEVTGWQPPAPPEGTVDAPIGFWEGTDDWAPSIDEPGEAGTDPEPTVASECTEFTGSAEALIEGVAFDGASLGGVDPLPSVSEDAWGGSSWDPSPWTAEPSSEASTPPVDVNAWAADEWPQEPSDEGAWEHEPDPAAVDTGFYVDWGTPGTETPPVWGAPAENTDALVEPLEPADALPAWPIDSQPAEAAPDTLPAWPIDSQPAEAAPDTLPAWPIDSQPAEAAPDALPAWDSGYLVAEPVIDSIAEPTDAEPTAPTDPGTELAPISWRADGPEPAVSPSAMESFDPSSAPASEGAIDTVECSEPREMTDIEGPAFEPFAEPVEPFTATFGATEVAPAPSVVDAPLDADFVTAGPDWELGNALPLVEVRGQGALVMRRADERWALADVITPTDFAVEVDVDFRSGPGLGVLFRASVDSDGRMSGYSFDIDPIYDGGGYLVRQWQADRELWNPIARASASDPASMYGKLTVRVVLIAGHLVAFVNGIEVLSVENLKEASAERGRDAAEGDRVGVQAWSSSDLVIETLRVAAH